MAQEAPNREVVSTIQPTEIATYKCINCGASLDGPGTCSYCGTHYRAESFQRTTTNDGDDWIRVNPDFPPRLDGGKRRDNQKEIAIENNFLTRLNAFLEAQTALGNEAQANDFLSIFLIAAYRHNSGLISGSMPDGVSAIDFIRSQGYQATANQDNLVRALPELMEDKNFWTDFFTEAIRLGRSITEAEALKNLRTELEKAFGFLIPLSSDTASASPPTEVSSATQPEAINAASFFGRLKGMFSK